MSGERNPLWLRELAALVCLKTARKLRSSFSLIGGEASQVEETETIRADLEAEEYIVSQLRAAGFKGKVVTEEAGVVELGDSDLVAVVDPLDGSVNFALGIPWSSVSLAFAVRDRREATLSDVVAGAVVPVVDPLPITFMRGRGVYLGDSPLKPLGRPFSDATVVAFYGDDPEALRIYSRIHARLAERRGRVKARSLGSVALDLVYVALRRIDLFVDARAKLRNVDVAAALGVLRELGGTFKDVEGRELNFTVEEIAPVSSLIASWSPEILSVAAEALGWR